MFLPDVLLSLHPGIPVSWEFYFVRLLIGLFGCDIGSLSAHMKKDFASYFFFPIRFFTLSVRTCAFCWTMDLWAFWSACLFVVSSRISLNPQFISFDNEVYSVLS